MQPKLSSNQETVLEELMQHSFGAQYLYAPERYRKGSGGGSDEPCDLMWYGNGLLILFYAQAGKRSIEKQDAHNFGQARRWARYWANNPKSLLCGKNRFGERIELGRAHVENWIAISVVSHQAGIVFQPDGRNSIPGFLCTIPESLVHSLSKINGTVIDLLQIMLRYSTNLSRHISRHSVASADRLSTLVKSHSALVNRQIEGPFHVDPEFSKDNFDIIYHLLARNRMNGAAKVAPEERHSIAEYFCDLSAQDFYLIAQCALTAIHRSAEGIKSVALATNGLFIDWIVFVTSIGATNAVQIHDQMRADMKNVGKSDLPTIIYTCGVEAYDYRTPFLFTFPDPKKRKQAAELMNNILKKLKSDPIRGALY